MHQTERSRISPFQQRAKNEKKLVETCGQISGKTVDNLCKNRGKLLPAWTTFRSLSKDLLSTPFHSFIRVLQQIFTTFFHLSTRWKNLQFVHSKALRDNRTLLSTFSTKSIHTPSKFYLFLSRFFLFFSSKKQRNRLVEV